MMSFSGSRSSASVVALLLLLLAACTTAPVTSSSPDVTTVPPTEAAAATTATVEAPTPKMRLERAIDGLVDSGSYAFEVEMLLDAKGTAAEVELKGWVDGDDRELSLTAGGQTVVTSVIEGVATVERDGEVSEIPLGEASESPSIEMLLDLRDLHEVDDSSISGSLNASDLKGSGLDVNGSAEVVVFVDAEGRLAGYSMTASNGAWEITTRFFDLGESFGEA